MPASPATAVDSLWHFAVSLHASPGLEPLMLTLQDEAGLDIPELLWMCWLQQRTEHVVDYRELAPIRAFRRRYTEPLRDMRRALKPLTREQPQLVAMRKAIKQAELESERESLRALALLKRLPAAPSEAAWQHWLGDLGERHQALVATIRQQARTITLE